MGIFTTLKCFLLPGMRSIGDKIVRMIYEKERTCFIIYLFLGLVVNMDPEFYTSKLCGKGYI